MTTTQPGENAQGSNSLMSGGGTSMVEEAKRNATKVAAAVEGRAEQGLESAKEEVAGRADKMANAVDSLAREFRENDESWLGDKAAALAATLRRTGQNVQERRVDELADDVREWSKIPPYSWVGRLHSGCLPVDFSRVRAATRTHRETTLTARTQRGDFASPLVG